MLSWTTPPNLVPVVAGQKPPANPASRLGDVRDADAACRLGDRGREENNSKTDALAARKKAMASARPTENRIYYADYRDVDGLQAAVPLRRAVGATTVEETVFDRYRINARVDSRKFEVRK